MKTRGKGLWMHALHNGGGRWGPSRSTRAFHRRKVTGYALSDPSGIGPRQDRGPRAGAHATLKPQDRRTYSATPASSTDAAAVIAPIARAWLEVGMYTAT